MDISIIADVANAGAAWVALGLSALLAWDNLAQRKRLAARDAADRLMLSTELDSGALLLSVSYRPQSAHTRFDALIEVLKPATTLVSETTLQSGAYIIPTPGWDPQARQLRTLRVPLGDDKVEGFVSVIVALKALGNDGPATLYVSVLDRATSRALVKVRRVVSGD